MSDILNGKVVVVTGASNGVLFGAQAAARQMKKLGKAGSIVLMASMGGIAGAGITVAYSTSKGGVVLMAKALAESLGPMGPCELGSSWNDRHALIANHAGYRRGLRRLSQAHAATPPR